MIVTGKDVYRYLKLQENGTFKTTHKEIATPKNLGDLSTDISSHAWMTDGRFILCTEKGHIILMETNGDFKQNTVKSHKRNTLPINTVIPFSLDRTEAERKTQPTGTNTGFIVASLSGVFRVFMMADFGSRNPYKDSEHDLEPTQRELDQNEQLDRDLTYMKVTDMALSPKQDQLIFTTSSNQLLRVPINLASHSPSEGGRPAESLEGTRYDYMINAFHSQPIFGMDICLKKPILATCSSDRTVRVWNYGVQQYAMVPEIVQ